MSSVVVTYLRFEDEDKNKDKHLRSQNLMNKLVIQYCSKQATLRCSLATKQSYKKANLTTSEHILQTILESTHSKCSDMSLIGISGYSDCNKSAKFSENFEFSAIQSTKTKRPMLRMMTLDSRISTKTRT